MKPETPIFTAYGEFVPWDSAGAEKMLMLAVLRTALDDLRKSGELYREARRYLLSDNDYYLFSFRSICDHLKLCPIAIRRSYGLLEVGGDSSSIAA